MIVQMKKVSLVVLQNERKEALKSLRKLGVLHIEEVQGSSDELSSYKNQNTQVEKALSVLDEIKLDKKEAKSVEQLNVSKDKAVEIAKSVLSLVEEKKSCFDKISNNTIELDRFLKWGEINPEDFAYLNEKNVYLSMFEIPSDKYNSIGENVRTLLVSKDKSQTRFLLISDEQLGVNERPSGLPADAYQVVLPRCSTQELKAEITECEKRISAIEAELKSDKRYQKAMKDSLSVIAKDIELENLYSGMGYEDKVENESGIVSTSTSKSSVPLAWLTGFVPVDLMDKFEGEAKVQGWAYASSDPTEDDAVPTKLKNNKFVSLIYPLTDFLGTVPGYREYDISGWFLFFFTIFFGMIFGDGGYGALVTVGALFCLMKAKQKSPMLGLVLLLGFSTMVWGAVTCTWFGIKPENLPDILKTISIAPISNAYDTVQWLPIWTDNVANGTLTTANNLQIFCFTLALIQLCVAHLKGMGRYFFDKNYRKQSLKGIGEFGAFAQLIGMYWVVLSMVVNSSVFPLSGTVVMDRFGMELPIGLIAIGLVGGGFALSFIFANYDGSIGKSIMESVKNIISVLLGVVNVFSDIVSYIRLWAVGLAGSAISGTVNQMASGIIGGETSSVVTHALVFVAFIALLVFGHGLNMILNLLSVIVHGVRLNTLEFSNHLGMSWAGFKYKPFSEN